MKRQGYLYSKIYNINNLLLADKKARKGKHRQKGVKKFDLNKDDNIINLYYVLKNNEYNTSEYKIFKLFDGKEREIFQLPYYPDRIVHHAILNILEPMFVSSFTSNTYSCIKKRGIHKALKDLKSTLIDVTNTQYCLKLDINKFYPSINNNTLKKLLRRKFKDKELLNLLDNIIDSAKGVPIGNYLSQYFANFYLTYFDHWLKENKKVKYYFRYCDDIVILAKTKEELWILFKEIEKYLNNNLKLIIKPNYRIFPVKEGINFIGYKTYHNYCLLRPSIKHNFINMIKYNYNYKSIASYKGWLKWCNSINLQNKYL